MLIYNNTPDNNLLLEQLIQREKSEFSPTKSERPIMYKFTSLQHRIEKCMYDEESQISRNCGIALQC
jgi:hypothetical protein